MCLYKSDSQPNHLLEINSITENCAITAYQSQNNLGSENTKLKLNKIHCINYHMKR